MANAFKPRPRMGAVLRILLAGGLVFALSTAGSSAAEEDPWRPGLPKYEEFPDRAGWVSPRAAGINFSTATRQWIRIPPLYGVAYKLPTITRTDPSCRRLAPYAQTADYQAFVHLRSTRGARAPYGYLGPFTVRTLAFGSIPVEAQIRISQLRDGDDLPIGLEMTQNTGYFCAGLGPHAGPEEVEGHQEAAQLRGQVMVEVVALTVDGVSVKLRDTCRVREPSALRLSGREYFSLAPDNEKLDEPEGQVPWVMKTREFTMANGGLLTGKLAIPSFVGCLTSAGEDLSPLLTAAVSGPENPVSMRSEGLSVENPDGAAKDPLPPLPFPERTP